MARMGPPQALFQVAGVVRWRQHLAALAGAVAVSGTVAWGRLEPITVLDSWIVPGEVHPGEFVQAERVVKWNRHGCWSYIASTNLVDALKPPFTHQVEARLYGLPDYDTVTNREWQVPFTMPWGVTKLHTSLSFSCFPFFTAWPVVVELPELTFDVVPPKGGGG
jgi:hypothetical protein